jgi:competence protein ComEA
MSANRSDDASGAPTKSNEPCVNLNIARAEELIKLPGIGEVMAKRIIDYRERHGLFRRPQEIIIIEGFSENKYRAIAGMICVE